MIPVSFENDKLELFGLALIMSLLKISDWLSIADELKCDESEWPLVKNVFFSLFSLLGLLLFGNWKFYKKDNFKIYIFYGKLCKLTLKLFDMIKYRNSLQKQLYSQTSCKEVKRKTKTICRIKLKLIKSQNVLECW